MAVTQQLARVSAEYLSACRQSADESPDGDPQWDPPSADVLDLDWAPALLERVSELASLDDVHHDAIRRATEGDTAIDLGFLNTPPHDIGPFGPPATALSTAEVASLSELLRQIDMQRVLADLPTNDTEAASLIGHGTEGITGGPREYLLEHFNALRDFYSEASRQRLFIVLWWD